MKTKIKSVGIFLAVLLISAACFAACGSDDDAANTHKHTFSAAWEHNQTSHWHAADCEHTSERSGEERHSFTDGVCVCGYTVDLSAWEHNETTHWHKATFGGTEEKYGEALHSLVDNKCVCGVGVDLEYRFAVDAYTVTGYTGEFPAGATLTIPDKYNGCTVVAIEEGVFQGCSKIEKVVLPKQLRTLGESAFSGCASMQEINLEGVTNIGNAAFEGCKSLLRVTLNPALHTLGEQVFSDCENLEEIEIPEGITEIGRNMFLHCESLRRVTIPNSVKKILSQAFTRCTALETLTLPDTLEFIGMSAFRESGLKEIALPNTVSTLGSYAFTDCKALTKAVLSSAIRYSVDDWFGGCAALTEVAVPYVGSRYYKEGTDYTADGAAIKHFAYIFGTDTQSDALFTAVTHASKTYYLPKTLRRVTVLDGTVAENAFDGCDMITEIVLQNGVIDLRPAA